MPKTNKLLRIAHRGASEGTFQNSISAFKRAIKLKVDFVELDVRICKSGEPIVIHDSHLNNLTNGKGLIKNMTLKDIKKIKLKNGEPIPTLEEVLFAIDRRLKVDIDIKNKETVEPVVRIIEKFVKNYKWKYEDFSLSAFWLYILKRARDLNKQIPLAPNITFLPRIFLSRTHNYKMQTLKFSKRALRKNMIEKAHARNQKVWVWTINNPKEIEKYADWGVDGIVSDYPERIT